METQTNQRNCGVFEQKKNMAHKILPLKHFHEDSAEEQSDSDDSTSSDSKEDVIAENSTYKENLISNVGNGVQTDANFLFSNVKNTFGIFY